MRFIPTPRSTLVALLVPFVVLGGLVPAPAADGDPARPVDAHEATGGGSTAPEGGPVDDGWLPGPEGSAFAGFEGEPAPGGGPVWPEVRLDARRTTLSDGKNVDVQILHLDPGADVSVRPTLAGGSVRGTATVAAQSGDPLAGSVAATNGGFWLREPYGEPNGFFAIDGRLVSDAESQGVGPRGTVGWTADGRVVIDRIDTTHTLVLANGANLDVDGINRGHREYDELFADGTDSLLAYTPDHGGPVAVTEPRQPPPPEPEPTPAPTDPDQPAPPPLPGAEPEQPPVDLAVLRIAAGAWPAAGGIGGTVIGISRDSAGTFEPGGGEVIVVATGADAGALDGVEVGDQVGLSTTSTALDPTRDEAWAQVLHGLAGGPMIVKDSRPTDPGDWVSEGFEPQIHSDVRAPRTAIGVTADGRLLMVTADGRRPGITHGFTIGELAEYMISLGAVEALSLDGGGSSQMVVDGVLRNSPCCDSAIRTVATSLQVVHDYSFTTTSRLQGAGRIDTAVAIARAAHPSGSSTAVLAVSSSFPDALAGGPLAAAVGGPLLLTGTSSVPAQTVQALRDLGVSSVRLLGGEAVIAPEVVTQLEAAGFAVSRLAGDSRFDTAAVMARAVQSAGGGDGPSRAFLVPAFTFPDALIAAGPGGLLGMPVLLTQPAELHPAAADVLRGVDEVVVIDSDGQLSAAVTDQLRALGVVVTRLGGGGRYATSGAVNDWLAQQMPLSAEVIVARGDDFPDALAGGPLAAARQGRLMLVPSMTLDTDPATAAWFASNASSIGAVRILGGPVAVSSYTQWQLDRLATG